jgi:hypothetical protein
MSDLPTICTWYWKQEGGRATYLPEHVARWADMVRRNITMPHRLAVVTHEDINIAGLEVIRPPRDFDDVRIPTWDGRKPQCLRRLSMFRPDAEKWFGPRVISMDMDCVIGGPLDPLFSGGEDFKIMVGTDPRRRPYNGSLLMLKTGARPQVYADFTPERATMAGKHFLGSDQAWIAFCLGWDEKVWTEADGAVWYSQRYSMNVPDCRVMFFPGMPKPWQVRGPHTLNRWVQRHYALEMREAA